MAGRDRLELGKPPTARWWKITAAVLASSAGIGAGSMFFPDHFVVRSVEVTGTREEVAEEIREAIWDIVRRESVLFDRTNIFLVPRGKIEQHIPEQYSMIRTVQVLRELPGVVRVVVQERVPVALLYAGETYYALDERGVAFESVPADEVRDRNLPTLRDQRDGAAVNIGHPAVMPEVLSSLSQVLTTLPDRFGITVNYIEIPAVGTQELHVATHEEWMLLLDATRPLDDQFIVMEKVLSERLAEEDRIGIEYLDLRVAGKAYYR